MYLRKVPTYRNMLKGRNIFVENVRSLDTALGTRLLRYFSPEWPAVLGFLQYPLTLSGGTVAQYGAPDKDNEYGKNAT